MIIPTIKKLLHFINKDGRVNEKPQLKPGQEKGAAHENQ
jgi:hypothetical protein